MLGILLGGVPGVAAAKVVILGGGGVGENAIMLALGMGDVTVLDTLWLQERKRRTVTAQIVEAMKPGSVLVDVAIGQGGCFENVTPDDPCRSDLHYR